MQHHNSPANETTILENTGFKSWIRVNKTKFVFASAIFLAVLMSLLTSLSASKADAASICDKTASSNVQRLVDSLRPGQTGCLRKGVYIDPDKEVTFKNSGKSGNRITLRSYPGERAVFRGMIYVPKGSNYVTIRNMRLDGSYGQVHSGHFKNDRATRPSIRAWGSKTNILYNDITNRRPSGNPNLAGVCINVGYSGSNATNAIIRDNRIHHCGQMPRINREHGIYVEHSIGTKIQNNLIYANADRGVQLYPISRGTLVSGNVLWRNGQGLVIDANSSNNTVRNNVFSHPQVDWNAYQGPKSSGGGNRVNNNCFWSTGGSSKFKNGNHITASGNTVANPRYRSRGGFKITNRACLAKYSGTMAR